MEKMTYGKAVNFVLTNCDVPAEVKEKLEGLAASLAKKNGAERKPTKLQTENEGYKAAIVEFLNAHRDEGFTCTDLIKNVPVCAAFSTPKMSALMRQIVEASFAVKYADKKRTYFKAA